jgi:hypothetical protein
MPKLTDSQLVILSTAAARADHTVLPPSPSLTLNKASLTRVIQSLLIRGLVAERPATQTDHVWREENDRRLSLVITPAGLDALGITIDDPAPPELTNEPTSLALPSKVSGGKADAVLTLLRRSEGAGIADLNEATGWQAHSIRAFLSGLRKKGLEIARTKADDGKAVYRMADVGDTQ